jgi:hypothetical protein
MIRVQFSLARLMLGVAFTALACFATRFTWSFAGWLLLPSLAAFLILAWFTLISKKERTLLVGFTFGGVAGWLLEMCSLMAAKWGNGTYLLFLVFFSPLYSIEMFFDSKWLATIIFSAAPLLYSLYATAVIGATRSQWGPACFVSIAMFHYSLVPIGLFAGVEPDPSRLYEVWPETWYWIILAVILFVAMHVGTVLFLIACSRQRHRLRVAAIQKK